MFVLNCDIKVVQKGGKTLRFTRVNSVEIESSAKVLEDAATVILPTTARLERQGEFVTEVETAKQFNVGDQIMIDLGYNGFSRREFTGYISKIKPGTPLEIECVDAIWLLRRKNMKESLRNVRLKTLLEMIVKDTGVNIVGDVPDIAFTHYTLRNVTAAFALQKLKDDYGLTMYLKNNELNVGLTGFNDEVTVVYAMGENVIEHDLEWISEDDVRLKVKAIHIKRDNTKVEKEVGDADGETRTLYFYDLERGADLEKVATEEMKKYKYEGYRGGLTTFLQPYVQVGNVAALRDPNYLNRTGDYLVDKVTTTFGQNGARRKIELGIKIS